MNILKIDIQKSLNFEKLYFKKSLLEKIWENSLIIANLSFFLYITGTTLFDNLIKSKPFGWSLFFFILVITITLLGLISFLSSNNLERITGLEENKNTKIVKKIADKNNWKIYSNNKHLDIINISFLDTQTDYGKQLIIIYDQHDILINCISFALGKTPNPFNWFSNKKMIDKFKTEFKTIKTHYNTV